MKSKTVLHWILGAAVSLSGSQVLAADREINMSGATLFESFAKAPASTNDYIDVDNDGAYGFDPGNYTVDQLAATWVSSGWTPYWSVQYRGVGSGNGLAVLVAYHNTAPGMELAAPSDFGLINRVYFKQGATVTAPPAVPANPGIAPEIIDRIDIAVLDVPTKWFVIAGAVEDSAWTKNPTENGYGRCPLFDWTNVKSNALVSLGSLNTNTSSPDANTVFDSTINWSPIALIANPGVGHADPNIVLTEGDAKYLFTTGRMSTGENLVAVTRDAGSGTRNGSMNCIGIDPSWARGDNYGAKCDVENETLLGPNHKFSNLGGSGIMEKCVQNRRLAVGYTGLVGSSRATGDAAAGYYEIVNFQRTGATQAVRPGKWSVLNNGDINSGWQIGGPETLATVGNPGATAWDPDDPNLNFPAEGPAFPMANTNAALFLRNILESIDGFINPGSRPAADNTPGQYLGANYFLLASTDAIPNPVDPSSFIPNPGLVQELQDYTYSVSTLSVPAFGSYQAGSCKVPTRTILTGGLTYSDGSTSNYIDAYGASVSGGIAMCERNKVMGDFDYSSGEKFKRNINDICEMMEAISAPRSFEQNTEWNSAKRGGMGHDCVIVEVIGDFNGDGDFDADDIRYFADGLAVDASTGMLERSTGYAEIDTCWTSTRAARLAGHPTAGNFFNTTLATGRSYQANSGWSKADIANASGTVAPGASPIGSDGSIGSADITYLHYNLREGLKFDAYNEEPGISTTVRSQSRQWSDASEAVWMDLSCDMDDDLDVDGEDARIVVEDILGTTFGDVNLNGTTDLTDRGIIVANISSAYGRTFAEGDINGDGYVSQEDVTLFDGSYNSCWNYVGQSKGDANGNGSINNADLLILRSSWLKTIGQAGYNCCADFNRSGGINNADLLTLRQNWLKTYAAYPTTACPE